MLAHENAFGTNVRLVCGLTVSIRAMHIRKQIFSSKMDGLAELVYI